MRKKVEGATGSRIRHRVINGGCPWLLYQIHSLIVKFQVMKAVTWLHRSLGRYSKTVREVFAYKLRLAKVYSARAWKLRTSIYLLHTVSKIWLWSTDSIIILFKFIYLQISAFLRKVNTRQNTPHNMYLFCKNLLISKIRPTRAIEQCESNNTLT